MILDFFSHGNIMTRYYYNSGNLHRDDKRATLLTDNFLSAPNQETWMQSL